MSTTFRGIESGDLLKPALDQTTFFATTYYPLTPDFRMRTPATVDTDFPRIFAAAGAKQVFLLDIGSPTSPNNGSSEDKQAEFFTRVLDAVAANQNRIIGVNFCFMSDFPDSLVQQFSTSYKTGDNRFGTFLKTLGMFDDKGKPKKNWSVFQAKLKSIKN